MEQVREEYWARVWWSCAKINERFYNKNIISRSFLRLFNRLSD